MLATGNLGIGKLILSQYGIRCFLTSIKLSKNFITFWKRTSSEKTISKGSFRVSYKRGHKNLKEFLTPSKVVLENTDALRHSKRQHHGECENVAVVGNRLKGGREAPEFTVVKYWRKIISPKVFRQGNSIELDRTLIAKVKMLLTWSHVKGVDYKGWDLV